VEKRLSILLITHLNAGKTKKTATEVRMNIKKRKAN
jgi:hypothetical protein